MTTTLLLQIAINRMERETWVDSGGRKEEAAGTGRQLMCQVRRSAHYCTSCKQNSCGLTHGERERGFEIPRKSGKLH
jgi:hypothetical protein